MLFSNQKGNNSHEAESKAAGVDAQLAGLTFKPIGCAIMVLIFDNI
jgi:hypothetical protein